MSREASAMTVRQNLGELLNEVQYRREKIIITKGGKPVAAMIDMELFEKIRDHEAEFQQMADEIANAFARIPAKKAQALVDEAVKAARRKVRKR